MYTLFMTLWKKSIKTIVNTGGAGKPSPLSFFSSSINTLFLKQTKLIEELLKPH